MATRVVRIVFDILSLLILLGTIAFLIVCWRRVPDTIPAHFDLAGQITGWSGKGMLILEPVIMAVIFLLLSFAKTMRFRSLGRQVRVPAPPLLFPAMKLVLLAGLAYMTVCTALIRPLGAWYFPVFLCLIFLPLILFGSAVLPQLRKQ